MSKDYLDKWEERQKQNTEIIEQQQTKTKKMKDNHKAFVYGFVLATIMCFIASCMIIGTYCN